MRVANINNQNFKGLWERRGESLVNSKNLSGDTPIIRRDVIYHPFSDETIDEAEKTFSKEKEKPVYKGYDEYYNLVQYIINDYKMGAPLNISKKDYEDIRYMEEHAAPYPFCTTYFMNSNDYPNEVKQVIED